jgi:hypothetical protein
VLEAIVPACQAVQAAWRAAGGLVVHTRESHRPDLSDCPPAKRLRGNPQLQRAFVAQAASPWAEIQPALEFEAGERAKARSFVSEMTSGEAPAWRTIGAGVLVGVLVGRRRQWCRQKWCRLQPGRKWSTQWLRELGHGRLVPLHLTGGRRPVPSLQPNGCTLHLHQLRDCAGRRVPRESRSSDRTNSGHKCIETPVHSAQVCAA